MVARYCITIDRSALEKIKPGDDPKHQARVIRVENTATGEVRACREVALPLGGVVRYGEPQRDGARVWIEAEGYVERG